MNAIVSVEYPPGQSQQCPFQLILVDLSDPAGPVMYATLLAAKAAGDLVRLNFILNETSQQCEMTSVILH